MSSSLSNLSVSPADYYWQLYCNTVANADGENGSVAGADGTSTDCDYLRLYGGGEGQFSEGSSPEYDAGDSVCLGSAATAELNSGEACPETPLDASLASEADAETEFFAETEVGAETEANSQETGLLSADAETDALENREGPAVNESTLRSAMQLIQQQIEVQR